MHCCTDRSEVVPRPVSLKPKRRKWIARSASRSYGSSANITHSPYRSSAFMPGFSMFVNDATGLFRPRFIFIGVFWRACHRGRSF